MSSGLRQVFRHSVSFQSVALAASTGMAQLIVAALYIWAARTAGPQLFGLLVAGIAIGTASVGFLDFGTNSYWAREIATGRMSLTLLGRRLTSKVFIGGLVALCWLGFTLWLVPSSLVWVAAPIAFSLLVNQSFQVSLRGIARADLVSVSIFIDRSVALVVFASLSLSGLSIVNCLWISLTVGSFCAAASGWVLTPVSSRPRLGLTFRTNPWASAGHYGLANVAVSAQSFDTPILTLFGGSTAAGIYGAVARWTQPMGLLANAFSSAAAPHMARANSSLEAWHHVRKSVWLPGVAIAACLGIAVTSPFLVQILVGQEYKDSAGVLQILALGTIPAIANQPLFVFLQARGFDKPVSFLAILNVVLQLGLVAILSLSRGAIGAAWAAAASQLIMLAGLSIIVVANRKKMAEVN